MKPMTIIWSVLSGALLRAGIDECWAGDSFGAACDFILAAVLLISVIRQYRAQVISERCLSLLVRTMAALLQTEQSYARCETTNDEETDDDDDNKPLDTDPHGSGIPYTMADRTQDGERDAG